MLHKPKSGWAETLTVVWNGSISSSDGTRTKGELLPRYERKDGSMDNAARIMPRTHKTTAE